MKIQEYLKQYKLLADGAFGTYFAQMAEEYKMPSELANIQNPELVKSIHIAYKEAGAKLIRTNTFAANTQVLNCTRKEQKEILIKGFEIASEAAKEIYVAADIGPIPEHFSSESDDILEEYQFICDTFLDCGAEIILFETFPDFTYIKPLVSYIKQKKEVFLMAEFCLDRYGYTKKGIKADRLLEQAGQIKELDAVGFNCGIGSGHMRKILEQVKLPEDKWISIMPNSNYPELLQDRTIYLENREYFAERMKEISNLGADILGGCCGTTPEYIKALKKKIPNEKIKIKDNIVKEEEKREKKNEPHNLLYDKLKEGKKVIAVELDPPYDAKIDKILECAHSLKTFGADILTFADSPMARARMDSILTGVKVQSEVDIPVMPHISCRDKNMIAMRAQLLGAYGNQIRSLLVVTGDPIPGSERGVTTSVFDFNSVQLMEFIKEMNQEHFSEEPFFYGGALNYARANIDIEIKRMQKKIEAGAAYFLSQPVFSKQDMEKISYIKGKVNTKILCGIMPLVSYRNAMFIKNEITGIYVPDDIINAFSPAMTREEGEHIGAKIAGEIMREVMPFVDGFYFMLPFNRVKLVELCLKYSEIKR